MYEESGAGTSSGLIPKSPLPELGASASQLRRMLEVVESEILPKTAAQVAAGNKFFGAAVLDSAYNTVVADTNRETECPLYHGEVYTIQQWAAVAEKPPVKGITKTVRIATQIFDDRTWQPSISKVTYRKPIQ